MCVSVDNDGDQLESVRLITLFAVVDIVIWKMKIKKFKNIDALFNVNNITLSVCLSV